MHIAQTRLSIITTPREIKEITAEVAEWTLAGLAHAGHIQAEAI